MSTSVAISASILDRLKADLSAEGIEALTVQRAASGGGFTAVPITVSVWPDAPTVSEKKTLARNGAIIIRYAGSKYGKLVRGRQDRQPHFEIVALSESQLPSGAHLGAVTILENAISRLAGWTPDGCISPGELVTDAFVDDSADVWEYAVTVAFWTRVGELAAAGDMTDSDHVREQIMRAVMALLTGLPTTGANVSRGSEPVLDPDAMPELSVTLGDEGLSPDDDSLGATMRVATLSVTIATLGDHTPEASTVMAEVEKTLFVDGVVGNQIFGDLARALAIGPVSSKYVTGGAIEYTETRLTYEVSYKTRDGYAETAI